MKTVAALFVSPTGPYFDLCQVDPWDESRDATRYNGRLPVVAHPPCARWCQLAAFVEHVHGIKAGQDGGLFKSALASVDRCGGVLEHPAFSKAFPRHGLVEPKRGDGWTRSGKGWVIHVDQGAYGHPAIKGTWLYYRGKRRPFALDTRKVSHKEASAICGMGKKGNTRPRLGPKSIVTPLPFMYLLLALAEYSRIK